VLKLKDKTGNRGIPLSPVTVNHCLTCLKIMLKEVVRLDYLQKNPAAPVRQLAAPHKGKSILTTDEVRELFSADNIGRVWGGDMRHYTLNLLAASTGMRMGEIQGLMRQYIHDKHIEVLYTWDRKYGLKKGPKWSSEWQSGKNET